MSECDKVIISKLKSHLFDDTSSGTSTIPKLIFAVVSFFLLSDFAGCFSFSFEIPFDFEAPVSLLHSLRSMSEMIDSI
jgi:hypothetical protein